MSFLPSVECGKFKSKQAFRSGKILACSKKSEMWASSTLKAHSHWHRDRVTWRHRSVLRDFEMSAWRDETTSFLFAMHTKRDMSPNIV